MTLFTPWIRDSGQVPAGAVRPAPIAVAHAGPQSLRPGGLAPPRPGVPPLPRERPVHALDPAVLPGAERPCVLVPDAAGLQGLVEEAAAVAGPVVGHDALDGHPARGGEGDRRRREGLADPVLDVGRGELRQRAGGGSGGRPSARRPSPSRAICRRSACSRQPGARPRTPARRPRCARPCAPAPWARALRWDAGTWEGPRRKPRQLTAWRGAPCLSPAWRKQPVGTEQLGPTHRNGRSLKNVRRGPAHPLAKRR